MNRTREENDVNDNLSVVSSSSKPIKQKSLSKKPLNGIAYNVYDMAAPAKHSKTKKTLSEDLNDEEKESVIQEVLDYMLGHRSPVASSSDCLSCKGVAPTKEKFSPSCSHNQHSVTDHPVYRSPPKHLNGANIYMKNVTTTNKDKKAKQTKIIVGKQTEEPRGSPVKKLLENGSGATTALVSTESTYASNTVGEEHFPSSKQSEHVGDSKQQHTFKTYNKLFGEKCSTDNHVCLEWQELKGVKSMTSSKRRSRYWGRKRCMQPLQSDLTDSFIMQSHQNNKSQSSKAITSSSTNRTPYWPRVLISSQLNDLFSRLNAENDNM
ncbi:hypothetical protein GHT06_022835 [Daphnia sinensis]|uniref:Uncharacterized protein n=1 Tax=Daphnia sinensis TaxID=1820382 RepID=A0AAD5KHN2_9CRUS|nr:hypothetical protein GHT06_022835 [Daphnia sinensis]